LDLLFNSLPSHIETKRNENQEFRKCKQQNDILSVQNIRPSSNVWFFLACVVEDGKVHEVGQNSANFRRKINC